MILTVSNSSQKQPCSVCTSVMMMKFTFHLLTFTYTQMSWQWVLCHHADDRESPLQTV